MTDFATKIRHLVPGTHILVDVDDGFGDEVMAANTIRILESNGLSAVMMEDQKRPRKCGHFEGKEVLPIEEYLTKLKKVIDTRQSLFVIARTDAADASEGIEHAVRYAEAGAITHVLLRAGLATSVPSESPVTPGCAGRTLLLVTEESPASGFATRHL